jgi:hypothetical protein
VRRKLSWRLGVGLAAAIAGLTTLTAWLMIGYPTIAIQPAQAQALDAMVDTYVYQRAQALDIGGALDPGLTPHVYCNTKVLELTAQGRTRWHLGMTMFCVEYARRGNTLLEGGGGQFISACEITTVSPHANAYRMMSFDPGPPGYDPAWVHQNFSAGLAGWLLSTNPPFPPDPVDKARRALGFPPRAKAIIGFDAPRLPAAA